jgi:hypothetical protein
MPQTPEKSGCAAAAPHAPRLTIAAKGKKFVVAQLER